MAIFDTSDIQTTGLTVTGKTVLSGNSSASILTISGSSNTIMTVSDNTGATQLLSVSTIGGTPIFMVTTGGTRVNTYLIDSTNSTGSTGNIFSQTLSGSIWSSITTLSSATLNNNILSVTSNNGSAVNTTINAATGGSFFQGIITLAGSGTLSTITNVLFTTAFTYNNANVFTITNNTGGTLTALANIMSALTISGAVSATTISAATVIHYPGTVTVAPIKFTTGSTLLTTASAGSMELDNTNTLYYTNGINSRGVIKTEQIVILTGITQLPNSAAAQRLFTGTSFSSGAVVVNANTSYYFETGFDLSGMSATLGTFSFGFSGTASVTACRYTAMSIKNTIASANTFDTQIIIRASGLTPISSATTGTVGGALIYGTLRIGGVGGTLAPITALSTAAAAVVAQDSYFKISPMGSNNLLTVGNWV